MIIEKTDVSPFDVFDVCIRQLKARDGASEGGWRLDVIIKNTCKTARSKLEMSLRYYDSENSFVGLDRQPVWADDYIKSDETKDLTFHIELPREAERVELRIHSKSSMHAWTKDPPFWLVFLIVLSVSGLWALLDRLIN